MTDVVSNKRLRLGEFLPFRLSVLSNTISKQIADASGIVAHTAMDKVAVSRAVTGLIEQGRLKRVTASDDGRRSHLHLTAQGQDIYDQIVPLAQAELDRIASSLSHHEMAQLNQILTKLAAQASPDRPLW